MDIRERLAAYELLGRVAGEAHHRGTHVAARAAFVQQHDVLGAVLNQAAKTPFVLLEHLHDVLAVRRVSAQRPHARAMRGDDQAGRARAHDGSEPPGRPPGRQNDEREPDTRLAPGVTVGRGLDAERVLPSGKIGVGGLAPPAVHVVPPALESFQLVAIPVFLGGGIAEGRKGEREDALRVRERQRIGGKDRPLQW
jgi:hypothetical protein